jgi:glycosyltransferase involved in cell wall biosynthesis
MRVTMLVRCLAMMRGGGETRHLAWARELTALGVDVDIITGVPLFGTPRFPVHGDASTVALRSPYMRDFVYRFQNRRGFGRVTMNLLHADEEIFCRAAWRRIASVERRPDVIHAHALYQAARTRTMSVPVVINLPGEPHARYAADLRQADALVADGWAADHVPQRFGVRVERVPKGVDAERFTPDGPDMRRVLQLEKKLVVLAVARLVPLKNLRMLLDAVAIVRPRVPNVHAVIVGEGPEGAALKDHALALDLSDAVTFVGRVAHRDTPPYYRMADVFALSSSFDNSPNAVLEAMACGRPVVATDVGGVREFVDDPVGAIVVPSGDAHAMAHGLERFFASDQRAKEASAHNRAKAASEFSWRASALRLLAVYQRAIDAHRPTERASA